MFLTCIFGTAFAVLSKKHFNRGEMRRFFKEGFRDKGRNEPDAEFAVRAKALRLALDKIKTGSLDRSFASKGDASKMLVKLRTATQGAGVTCLVFLCFCKLILLLPLYCVVLLLVKVAMNLRSRQLFVPEDKNVGEDSDDESAPGQTLDEPGFAGDLADEPEKTLQLIVPAQKKKKKRVVKRTLSCITDVVDAFKCPVDAYIPSNSELVDMLNYLYDFQTHLIDAFEDLPKMLGLLPELKCSLLLITVDLPQLIDFDQFVPILFLNHLGIVRSPPLLAGRDEVLKRMDGVFTILPHPWYFMTDTIINDMITDTSIPLQCATEFILFHPRGSRKSKPFPFRPKEMFEDGFAKRLFCNCILVPGFPAKQRLRSLENAQNPKQVLDENQQQPMTWFQMFSLFSEDADFPVVLNVGCGVGVGIFLCFAWFLCLRFCVNVNVH